MQKITINNLRKYFNYLSGMPVWLFVVFTSENASALTDYVVLERRANIHIFEKYLDYVDKNHEGMDLVKKISIEDEVFSKISKEYSNSISQVWYSKDGYVVFENKRFDFVIHFIHEHVKNSIQWRCKIIDKSIFFHPAECNGWEKTIRINSFE